MSEANTVSPPRALTTMQPFFRELSVNRETALALLDGLTAEQLAWRPTPTRWSLADLCGHLASTTTRYLPPLDESIADGHALAAYSDRPFRGTMISRLMVWMMEPPVRLRMRAPRELRPSATESPIYASQRYRTAQRSLEVRLERAAGLDLTHVPVQVPTLRPVQLSLGAVLALLLAHERRHLWQATVVRKAHDFPRGS